MLDGRGFSWALAIDLIAGAVDVWLHPAETLALARPSDGERGSTMLAHILGPAITRKGQRQTLAAMIATAFAIAGVWVVVHIRRGDNPFVDLFSIGVLVIGPLFAGLRFSHLKSRAASVQTAFFVMLAFLLAVIWIGAGLLATGL